MGINSRPLKGSPETLYDYYDGFDELVGDALSRFLPPNPPATDGGRSLSFGLYRNYHEGCSHDGQLLIQPGPNGKHTPLIDMPATAPKWFSTALAIADEAQRVELHGIWRAAALAAAARIEERAVTVKVPRKKTPEECARKTKMTGARTRRVPADLLIGVSHHFTARPNAETVAQDRPPDPHVHSHFAVFNMAWLPDRHHPDGGKPLAVDDWGLKKEFRRIHYELETDLVYRCMAAGYRVDTLEDRGKYRSHRNDLAGLAEFWSSNSRRAQALRAAFRDANGVDPEDHELRDLLRNTRHSKDDTCKGEPPWEQWRRTAREYGFPVPNIVKDYREERSVQERFGIFRERMLAPSGLTGDDAVFDRYNASISAARCGLGLGFSLDQLEVFLEQILSEDCLSMPGGTFTTWRNERREEFIDTHIDRIRDRTYPGVTPGALERACLTIKARRGIDLDDEQLAGVESITGMAGISFVEGYAGTGKTTMLEAAVEALRDRGSTGVPVAKTIVALSLARNTAMHVGEKIGADRADSIESFIRAVSAGRVRPDESMALFVDEAVMLDNDSAARLLRAAGNARIVFIGDPAQIQAIGAGGWYYDQAKKFPVHRLTKVHRQVFKADVDMLFALRSGRAAAALASLESRGRLTISQDRQAAIDEGVRHYVADRDSGRSVADVRIVLDGPNTEVDTVNQILQEDRLLRGELSGIPLPCGEVVSGRRWLLYAGDEVTFIKSHYDRSGTTITTGKGKVKKKGLHVANGTSAKVVSIKGRSVVFERKDGRQFKMDVTDQCAPSYAVHAMRLQGNEAPIIHCLPGMRQGFESIYSQASRCVERVRIYLDETTHGPDPLASCAKAWSKARPKLSARARRCGRHQKDAQQSREHTVDMGSGHSPSRGPSFVAAPHVLDGELHGTQAQSPPPHRPPPMPQPSSGSDSSTRREPFHSSHPAAPKKKRRRFVGGPDGIGIGRSL